jgi:hypothetical protein
LIISLLRCNDPANERKCKHVSYRNRGPENLELMHIVFGSSHVTVASASTPGDLLDNQVSTTLWIPVIQTDLDT